MDKSGENLHSHRFIKQNSVHEPKVLLIPHRENISTCLIKKKKSFTKNNDVERALIWILTPATSADKIASSSTCWHRNIMVRKCFCAMKQIGRSKYTAKNQTICFKRTQELVKTSWNIAGEKAAATPISEADRHCSCSSRVLSGPPALHCNDTFNEDKNFFSLTPKGLQNVPVLGVPLCMSGKRKIPNCLDLTSSSLRTGACLSSGHVNTGYLLHHDAKEKRNLKRLFYPLFFFHHSSRLATGITSHSSLQLSGCNSASEGLASLSRTPPVLYSTFTMRNMDRCSCLAHWPPSLHRSCFLSSLWLRFPLRSLCPTAASTGRMSREERTSLMLSSPRCRQAHCPPAPKCQQSSVTHGKHSVVKLYKKLLQGNMSPGKHTVAWVHGLTLG